MNNMRYYDYIIAEIRLRSDIDIAAAGIRGFKPFEVEYDSEATIDCSFTANEELSRDEFVIERHLSDFYAAETQAECQLWKTSTGYLYAVKRRDNEREMLYHIDLATHHIVGNSVCHDMLDISQMRFAMWVMFGVVLSEKQAIAIHSSTIEKRGRCILFLGESGTGKSTHTRLWRENIEDAHLLNDDSPIIRFKDGEARVYGSPWSGKTPCYRNLSYPIAGFCRLSQAPHNAIRKLPTIAAIGALLPSCPPAFAHDDYLQDHICSTLGKILRRVPTYHLECLPNKEAAELSYSTILGNE